MDFKNLAISKVANHRSPKYAQQPPNVGIIAPNNFGKPSRGKKISVKNLKRKKRKNRFRSPTLRHDSFMINIFEGRINGHKGRGGQRKAKRRNDKTECRRNDKTI